MSLFSLLLSSISALNHRARALILKCYPFYPCPVVCTIELLHIYTLVLPKSISLTLTSPSLYLNKVASRIDSGCLHAFLNIKCSKLIISSTKKCFGNKVDLFPFSVDMFFHIILQFLSQSIKCTSLPLNSGLG